MKLVFSFFLFIFGTLFGSFASVLIYRLKSKEGGILFGRSKCPKCNSILKFFDLFPIFSYLSTFGKCRYCKTKISSVYPILELSTGILFFLIGYRLIDLNLILNLNILEIIKLFYLLFLSFITILFIFYDILFLEINDGILLTGIIGTCLILILQSFFPSFEIIPTLYDQIAYVSIEYNIGMIIILGIIVALFYIIILGGLSEVYDVVIIILSYILAIFSVKYLGFSILNLPMINASFGALIVFSFLFLQILISKGAWMGGGDLRIAILMGLVLGLKYSLTGLFVTYIVGSVIGIGIIVYQKIKNKGKISTIIPFGPFLGIGLFVCLLWKDKMDLLISIIYN